MAERNRVTWSDVLTTREARFTEHAIEALRDSVWAQPPLGRVDRNGGLVSENMPPLFVVRYAYELHLLFPDFNLAFKAYWTYPLKREEWK